MKKIKLYGETAREMDNFFQEAQEALAKDYLPVVVESLMEIVREQLSEVSSSTPTHIPHQIDSAMKTIPGVG